MTFKEMQALFGLSSYERVIEELKARTEIGFRKIHKKESPMRVILPIPESWLGQFYDAEKNSKIIICTNKAYQGEDPEVWKVQVGREIVTDTLSTAEVVSLVKGIAGIQGVVEQPEFKQKLRPILAVFMSEAHSWGYKKATLPARPVTKPFEPPPKLLKALYSITHN